MAAPGQPEETLARSSLPPQVAPRHLVSPALLTIETLTGSDSDSSPPQHMI